LLKAVISTTKKTGLNIMKKDPGIKKKKKFTALEIEENELLKSAYGR
jgi:hypothetical protein